MFYKIEENEIKMCPQNGKLSDGTAISNLPKYFEKIQILRHRTDIIRSKKKKMKQESL